MAAPFHAATVPLAALTTVFTPPCPTSWLVATTRLPSQFPSFPAPGQATCDPPAWGANLAGRAFPFYSPAICPDGFAVGLGCSLQGKTQTAEGFAAVTDSETVAWCVPSGYSCTSDTTDFRGGIWGVRQTDAADISATVTVGPALQIRWRAADLTLLATHPLTPGLTLDLPVPSVPPVTSVAPGTPAAVPEAPPARTASSVPAPQTVDSSSSSSSSSSENPASTQPQPSPLPAVASKAPTAVVLTFLHGSTQSSTSVSVATTRSTSKDGSRSAVAAAAPTTANDRSRSTSSSSSTTAATATATTPAAGESYSQKTVTAPSVHRAVVAVAVVVSLLSVAATGLAVFFFLARRRQKRRLPSLQQNNGPSRDHAPANELDSGPDSGFTAIGTGAWIRTQPSRLAWLRGPVVAAVTAVTAAAARWRTHARWPAALSFSAFGGSARRDGEYIDPELAAWRRPARTKQPPTQEQEKQRQQNRAGDGGTQPCAELEGSAPVGAETRDDDADSDDGYYGKAPRGDDPTAAAAEDGRRRSWMVRLSRFLRTGGESRSSRSSRSSSSTNDTKGLARHRQSTTTSTSRASTRWSRWTVRTEDGCEHDGGAYDEDDERSWAVFARRHGCEGAGAVVVVDSTKKDMAAAAAGQQVSRPPLLLQLPRAEAAAGHRGHRGPAWRTGHSRGLSVPPGRESGGGGGSTGAGSHVDDTRSNFDRLSNGTFGNLASPARSPWVPMAASRRSSR